MLSLKALSLFSNVQFPNQKSPHTFLCNKVSEDICQLRKGVTVKNDCTSNLDLRSGERFSFKRPFLTFHYNWTSKK